MGGAAPGGPSLEQSMTTRIDVTLEGLRNLRARVDRRQLAAEDWAAVGALGPAKE